MFILDNIYFNFYSFAALIPTVFCLYTGVLFISLKDKTRGALFTGIFLLGLSVFNGGYLIAGALYHSSAAFHRWITVASILPVEIYVMQATFYFPSGRYRTPAKIFHIVQWPIAIGVFAWFAYATWDAPRAFNFEGHYWNFVAADTSKTVSRFIILFVVFYVSLGLYRGIRGKRHERTPVFGLLLGVSIVSILPSILNILSISGRIDRGLFQTMWDLCLVLGCFFITITFINYGRDKMSVMGKIIGITFVAVLLLMQFLGYFSFNDKERAYDAEHMQLTARVFEKDLKPEDLEYRLTYDATIHKVKSALYFTEEKNKTNFSENKFVYENILTYEKIKRIPLRGFKDNLRALLSKAPKSFGGYGAVLTELAGSNLQGKELKTATLELLLKQSQDLEPIRRKIQTFKPDNMRDTLKAYLDSKGKGFPSFAAEMRKLLDNGSLVDQGLKTAALGHIAPVLPAGTRMYRTAVASEHHFTAFVQVDTEAQLIYEAGYSYLFYRKFIHKLGIKLTVIFIVMVFIVLLVFRFFFKGALTDPLSRLMAGVERVKQGEDKVFVPVTMHDEIGFISGNFNKMVRTIFIHKEKLSKHAETLEDKVQERTNELQTSLTEVQTLKTQQDGDYFLTSLLTAPLNINTSNSEVIDVEFLIKQKKDFEFRHWRKDIGGDVCIAHDIQLRGKNYTVFINGDAMGKSMQGAGGAIVMGSVFQMIITRTWNVEAEQQMYPEEWMKKAFLDLHNVFESFNGSMLMSSVLGILEEHTGLLYYINAEHPLAVIYRDGKAEFLPEHNHIIPKMGTPGLDFDLSVLTYQLKAGDILCVGSDGKDDLVLSHTEEGLREINEDENLFLQWVQNGKGDLKTIYNDIVNHGDIMDDLSMIRIAYRIGETIDITQNNTGNVGELIQKARKSIGGEDFPGALKLLSQANNIARNHMEANQLMVKVYIKTKDYVKGAELAEKMLHLHPGETSFLFLASFCNKKIRNFEKAIRYGELNHTREPTNVRNMVNLADIYLYDQKKKRAQVLIDKVESLEPGHKKLKALKAALLYQSNQL